MTCGSPDSRFEIYRDLNHNQIRLQEAENRQSASLLLAELFRHYRPKSVLDVGCGLGTWLSVAQAMGVADIQGIEGHWLDRNLLQINDNSVVKLDLERPFKLERRFDLLICLEVAEHLSPNSAARFVESLVHHSDVVLFSAAIPHQGGHHHVNEQFLDYWSQMFQSWGYEPVDFLRQVFWNNPAVLWWLRQNVIIFAKRDRATGKLPFPVPPAPAGPLSIVHPDIYLNRLKSVVAAVKDHKEFLLEFSSGNTFQVVRNPDGQLTVRRTS